MSLQKELLSVVVVVLALAIRVDAATPAGTIRAFDSAGPIVWAVGDRGAVLRSGDGGKKFEAVACEVTAHWRAVSVVDAKTVLLAGGQTMAGFDGLARGVVVRSRDGGKTWETLTANLPGMLYGLVADEVGKRVIVWGQASSACPSGAWKNPMGERFMPIASASSGCLVAGAGKSFGIVLAAGPGRRVMSVRAMAEPPRRPGLLPKSATVRAMAYTPDDIAWAVGDDATVVFKAPGEVEFVAPAVRLPGPIGRLADFEAVAFVDGQTGLIGGGQFGALLYTDDGGASFVPRKTPPGAAVHAMHVGPDDVVLIGGDHGRIWRSTDIGGTFEAVNGRAGTDLLVIASPADLSIWPMVAAHTAAGLQVMVCFAATPADRPGMPQRQALELACAEAGAGCIALNDFESLAVGPDRWFGFVDADVLARWRQGRDRPPRAAAVSHLAAVIRLTRPIVLATGAARIPRNAGGVAPELRLFAELAAEAAKAAAEAESYSELARAYLTPHAAARVATGQSTNAEYRPPWSPGRLKTHVTGPSWLAWRYPPDSDLPLGILALAATAPMPWVGAAERSAAHVVYGFDVQSGRPRLLTDGLIDARRAVVVSGPRVADAVANGSVLSLAELSPAGYGVALGTLAREARRCGDDPLPADRMYLGWQRLCELGKLVPAIDARRAFLDAPGAKRHPLFARTGLATLAQAFSAEWRAQLGGREGPMSNDQLRAAVDRLAGRRDWLGHPGSQMLLAKGYAAVGKQRAAAKTLKELAKAPLAGSWPDLAKTELGLGKGMAAVVGRRHAVIVAVSADRFDLDGRAGEPFWEKAVVVPLSTATSPVDRNEPRPNARVAIAGDRVVLAFTLPKTVTGWRITAACDIDRDGWTDYRYGCDTDGKRWSRLHTRNAPTAKLGDRAFGVQAKAQRDAWTFELAIPTASLGYTGRANALVGFQVRCQAINRWGQIDSSYYFAPQTDEQMMPHRYGLMILQPAAARTPAK